MLGNIAELIAGLLLLIWGADRFVHGAAATARNLGVAPLLIGLTVVAFATSAPEILVSIVAAFRGETDLAVGNAIGSNIANIGLVLGSVALVRPIEMTSATLRREMPALLAVTMLTVSLFLDSYLSRVDGLVLLTGLAIVMVWLTRLGFRSSASDPLIADYDRERYSRLQEEHDPTRPGKAAKAPQEPVAAPDPPAVRVRFGEHESFSRVVFDWTREVDFRLGLEDLPDQGAKPV
ncbi:MAG: hypothetical protein ACE5KS_04635, partial [Woeseiaceae bacterium]